MNDAPTPHGSAPAPKPAGSERSEDRAAQKPKHRRRVLVWSARRARVVPAGLLDHRELGPDRRSSTRQAGQTRPTRSSRTRTSSSSSASSRSTSSTPTSMSRPRSKQKLPRPAQPLAAPVAAATRQLATNVAEKALASPQVQDLVSTAIAWAQQQFVSLIEDKGQFVSTHGRRRHPRVRERRRRPGHPPGRRPGDDLPDPGLHPGVLDGAQAAPDDDPEPRSSRCGQTLSQAQAGTLTPQAQAEPHDSRNGSPPSSRRRSRASRQKIEGIQARPPPSSRAGCPNSRAGSPSSTAPADAVQRTGRRGAQGPEPGEHPRRSTPGSPRSRRGSPTLLDRQAVQHPGELVLMKSESAERAPDLVSAAAQPRLRAAAAGAPPLPGAPSTWRRGGAGRL